MSFDGLFADQCGVISHDQILDAGGRPSDVKRMIRRRELVRIHRGVYLNHTGEPTWMQRAWAGILATQPSALSHESALRAWAGPGCVGAECADIHIAVEQWRHLRAPEGVVLHRVRGLADRVAWNLHPPRMKFDEALADVPLSQQDRFDTLGVLAKGVSSRRTTPERLLRTGNGRNKIAGRAWIESVLTDLAAGTCSVLEHGYLHRVERAHGLPRVSRQRRDVGNGRVFYRDNAYERLIIELDGRLFHDAASARDADAERDLDAATQGGQTLRILYGQVFRRPCSTALKIATVLQQHGWLGIPMACGPGCVIRGNIGVA